MSKDKDSVTDILEAIEEILVSMGGVSFAQLSANREKQAAILYFVIIMGEATKRLSKNFRASHPEIDWQGIAGMRDILAHQYDRVDIQVIWDVV
ncbi:HepT-like ribonuclease domain-containing protein [Prochlorothrix hollandica]|uniref:DUF86 domain-containing protein n=1 Tax=Prochlorothrix hollandica PCC 9006 = CALU 1027 TaxID=317619 RepID=A0A0M2PYT8_PROHO|nr:HepT-like ribonuclease domain-containing protein [Prochlorothrix hollandica]KKJ00248.1 hypothetical protein PROH_11200 [Prochlorothrix hollandica PCC 9006 = CALU 1027]